MTVQEYHAQLWQRLEYYADLLDQNSDARLDGLIDSDEYHRRRDILEQRYLDTSHAMEKFREATDPVWAAIALAQEEYKREWIAQNGPIQPLQLQKWYIKDGKAYREGDAA